MIRPGFPLAALLEPAACLLTAARWNGVKNISELRFREGGPVFAQVAAGKARLHLPVGSAADGAGLEISDESFALRGHLAGADVLLHPAKASHSLATRGCSTTTRRVNVARM